MSRVHRIAWLAPLACLAAITPASAREGAPEQVSSALRLQVLLDRAHFSVGEIDGVSGSNTTRALDAFRAARKLPGSGPPSPQVWNALQEDTAPILVQYTITEEDAAGPFPTIPEDMMEKASLESLGYQSLLEKLAETFHASPKLLQRLNPEARFEAAGEVVRVPNVTRAALEGKALAVRVDQSDGSVSVLDREQRVIARYPATMGSEKDPLPVGRWKVNGVSRNPPFNYNPDLFWDADPSHSKAKLAPGPNNPVGVVWVDLSREHYGIHGTPEPASIGKTQSHGCIRLTNWDVLELADLVTPGVPAILQK
jgi:lipoprotein-anchoring transpeptidase ErfK/SrfK